MAAMTVAGVNTTDAERIRVLFVEDEFFIREWIARRFRSKALPSTA